MTISEVIEKLEMIKVRAGDIQVVVNGDSDMYEVNNFDETEYLIYNLNDHTYISAPAILIC